MSIDYYIKGGLSDLCAGFHAGSNWNLAMLGFVEGGKLNPRTRRKTHGARRAPTTNSTHIWHRAVIEPGSHWWEAGALTTEPFMLPKSMRLQLTNLVKVVAETPGQNLSSKAPALSLSNFHCSFFQD